METKRVRPSWGSESDQRNKLAGVAVKLLIAFKER
jgi:hypothetical protein